MCLNLSNHLHSRDYSILNPNTWPIHGVQPSPITKPWQSKVDSFPTIILAFPKAAKINVLLEELLNLVLFSLILFSLLLVYWLKLNHWTSETIPIKRAPRSPPENVAIFLFSFSKAHGWASGLEYLTIVTWDTLMWIPT